MPFVRITILKSVSKDEKRKISTAIHQALIQEFNVPAADYFHVIEAVENEDLFYPENYLGIAHSGNMVYVQIIAGSGRSYEQKEKLYTTIAKNISKTTTLLPQDVIIVLIENGGKENWSFGNGRIQELSHIKS